MENRWDFSSSHCVSSAWEASPVLPTAAPHHDPMVAAPRMKHCPNTTSVPLDWQHCMRTDVQHQPSQQAVPEGAMTPKGGLCSVGHRLPC